jgi:sialidase-1
MIDMKFFLFAAFVCSAWSVTAQNERKAPALWTVPPKTIAEKKEVETASPYISFEKWAVPKEGELAPFLEDRELRNGKVFEGGRFPNVVVAPDGAVIATWGRERYRTRRSPDGGATWEDEVVVADPGFHGGGALVDEMTGDLVVFVEPHHPPSTERWIYRSSDSGKSWSEEKGFSLYALHRREDGVKPSFHMDEHGITLRHGPFPGRLIRTTSNYMGGNVSGGPADAFVNTIYSDDGGKTWDTSAPFPAFGTNEAAVVELSDGRLLLIARRHLATDGLDQTRKHFAWSYDGGYTWRDLRVSPVLPDGNTNSRYGLMHGLIRLPVEEKDILILSNVESDTGRERGTVWASFDGGVTWPLKRLVEPGAFAYSSLSAGRQGTPSEGWIYLLYEHGSDAHLARFTLGWLLQGELTGDGDLPGWAQEN